jgi:putative tryptophan/tyrosine transport system substrate-binding protein
MKPRIAGLLVAVLLGLVASSGTADAQQPVNIPRVGFFRPAPPSPELARILESFKRGLREQGYVEGQNVAVEVRFPTTTTDQLSGIAAELVRLKPDAIFAVASSGIDAVRAQRPPSPSWLWIWRPILSRAGLSRASPARAGM